MVSVNCFARPIVVNPTTDTPHTDPTLRLQHVPLATAYVGSSVSGSVEEIQSPVNEYHGFEHQR